MRRQKRFRKHDKSSSALSYCGLEQRRLLAAVTGHQSDLMNLAAENLQAPTDDSSNDRFAEQLHFSLGESLPAKVEFSTELADQIKVDVQVGDQQFSLQLQRYSIRTENFRVLLHQPDGSFVEFDAGEDKTFRGTVPENPNLEITAVLLSNGLHATAVNNQTDTFDWQLKPSEKGDYTIGLPAPVELTLDSKSQHEHDQFVASEIGHEHEHDEQPDLASTIAATTSPPIPSEGDSANAVILNSVTVKQAEIAFDVGF